MGHFKLFRDKRLDIRWVAVVLMTIKDPGSGKQIVRWDISSCKQEPITVEDSPRILVTPNYPERFPYQLNCVWTLKTRGSGYVIRIDWPDFRMLPDELCERQRVIIEDLSRDSIAGPYCGQVPPPPYISAGSMVTVHAISDVGGDDEYRGFAMSFKAVSKQQVKEANSARNAFNNAQFPVNPGRGRSGLRRPPGMATGTGRRRQMGRQPGPVTQRAKLQPIDPDRMYSVKISEDPNNKRNHQIAVTQTPQTTTTLPRDGRIEITNRPPVNEMPRRGISLDKPKTFGTHITSVGSKSGAAQGMSLSTKLYNRLNYQSTSRNTKAVINKAPKSKELPKHRSSLSNPTPAIKLDPPQPPKAEISTITSSNNPNGQSPFYSQTPNQQQPFSPFGPYYPNNAAIPVMFLTTPPPKDEEIITTPGDPLEVFFTQWTATKGFIFGVVCLVIICILVVIIKYKVQMRRQKKNSTVKHKGFEELPPSYSSIMTKYFKDTDKFGTFGNKNGTLNTSSNRSSVTCDLPPPIEPAVIRSMSAKPKSTRHDRKPVVLSVKSETLQKSDGGCAAVNAELERERSRMKFGAKLSGASSRGTSCPIGGTLEPPPLPERPHSLRMSKEENREKLKSLKKQLKLRKKLQEFESQ